MSLPQGIGQGLRPVTLHQRVEPIAIQFVASVRQVRKIRPARYSKAAATLRSKRAMPPRVLKPVQNHGSSLQEAVWRL